jgi:hypothetical protein
MIDEKNNGSYNESKYKYYDADCELIDMYKKHGRPIDIYFSWLVKGCMEFYKVKNNGITKPKVVKEYINEKTNFSKAASDILNNGALIQIYSNVKNMGGKIILFPFQTQYPSETITGVVMDATTRYKSTAINGKLGFQILKNGAKPEPIDAELDGEPITKTPVDFDPETTRAQIRPKGRQAEPRNKDSSPRQKRDK